MQCRATSGKQHHRQSGGRGSEGKAVKAFITIVLGTSTLGQEVKHMMGFVVGGFVIFSYIHMHININIRVCL